MHGIGCCLEGAETMEIKANWVQHELGLRLNNNNIMYFETHLVFICWLISFWVFETKIFEFVARDQPILEKTSRTEQGHTQVPSISSDLNCPDLTCLDLTCPDWTSWTCPDWTSLTCHDFTCPDLNCLELTYLNLTCPDMTWLSLIAMSWLYLELSWGKIFTFL